jgi:hypothetical protein
MYYYLWINGENNMKLYVGISRDHSYSMTSYGLTGKAMEDYNSQIASLRSGAFDNNIDTVVSVVKCGHGSSAVVHDEIINSSIVTLKNLTTYDARGNGTPLFDSIGRLIELMEAVPDAKSPDVSFLIIALTDGEDNRSFKWAQYISSKIHALQATDHWTFAFRVPRGHYKQRLTGLGIPEGNIQEWDTTNKGLQQATAQTHTATQTFYRSLASGARSTRGYFQTDMANISKAEVKSSLEDISRKMHVLPVPSRDNGKAIADFVEKKIGHYLKGDAFYQLTKPEKALQDYKQIAIRDHSTGHIYGGSQARSLLGLPEYGDVKVAPGDHGNFDIFVQSTSVNRKLVGGTDVLVRR